MKRFLLCVLWPIVATFSIVSAPLYALTVLIAICMCLFLWIKTKSTGRGVVWLRSTWVMFWPVLAAGGWIAAPAINDRYERHVSYPLTELGAQVATRGNLFGERAWFVRCKDESVNDGVFKQWVPILVRLDVRDLILDGSHVTDRSISKVVTLRNLWHLSLSDTQITNNALKSVALIESLHSLCVANTDVSDEGMKYLREMRNLSLIDLHGTSITDAGLLVLADLPELHHVDARNTRVTPEGERAFERRTHAWVRLSDNDPPG